MRTTITTLMENSLSHHTGLLCAHGLSFHVQTPTRTFLFDCGPGPAVLHNADSLNIDPARLDFVVGSHSHYDHGNGFRPIVSHSGVRRLVTGQGYFLPKYRVEGMRHTYLGVDFDKEYLNRNSIEHTVCADLLPVDEGCWLLGEFARTEPQETPPAYFMLRRDGAFVPDHFDDEICLALRLEDGLALLVGCSHPGILNIAKTAAERLGLPIRGIWGGVHLSAAEPARIEATLAGLKKLGVKRLGLSHCSGEAILELAARDPDMTVCRLGAGDGICLDGQSFAAVCAS